MDSSPAQHVVSPINFDTVQPARERRPSYRQSYEDWRSGEGSSSVKGEVHGIRVATYISGALATPHGSAAQFRRVSSVNLLAKSLEHANELYDELESLESKLKVTSLLGGCLCVAAFASFLNGYHTSVMNAAEATALPGHGSFAWSVAVSALPVGGPFGSWVGGKAADGRLGRDGALWSIGALYGLGGIALCWGLELQRIDVVIGARLLLGVACGATTVVVPVYLGELAPPRLRGAFGTLTQLAMVVGILAADVVALGAGAGVLFAASALVALAMLLLAGALPLAATPKSVLAVGRAPRNTYGDVDDTSEDWVEAVELCKRLYALDDESARDEAHCIAAAAAAVARDEDPATPDADRGSLRRREEATGGDRAAVAARARRVLFASTFVLHATQQLSGINAVFYYSTTFLDGVIPNPALGTALVGLVNVVATMLASSLMDGQRRVTMLALSIGGMLVSAAVLTLALQGLLSNAWALVGVILYVFFFELGLGPIPWMIVPELFTTAQVVPAQAMASQLNWCMNILVGLGFPVLNATLGAYAFLPFAAVLVAALVFVLAVLPETFGRTPEDVFRELTLPGGRQAYGAVSTLELEYELARGASLSRSRSRS